MPLTIRRFEPSHGDTLIGACRLSLLIPLLQLVFVRIRQIHVSPESAEPNGADGWLEQIAEVANAIIRDDSRSLGSPAELQFAKKTAMRAIRIMQGYEPAANDKAYQEIHETLEQQFGAAFLTDELEVALCNGMVYALAARNTYLDHVAGALVPLEPKTPKARL